MSVYKYITASVTEPTSQLRLVGPTRRVTTGRHSRTYSHSCDVDERSGVRTPYRANAQCRERTPTTVLNMGRQEPTLPVPDCNQISLEFYIPQHTCATKLALGRY